MRRTILRQSIPWVNKMAISPVLFEIEQLSTGDRATRCNESWNIFSWYYLSVDSIKYLYNKWVKLYVYQIYVKISEIAIF